HGPGARETALRTLATQQAPLMNNFGHQNQEASHMSDEEADVEASVEGPAALPISQATRAPAVAPAALGHSLDPQILAALVRGDRDTAAATLVDAHARALVRT